MYFDARKAKALTEGQSYAVDGCPGLRLEAGKTKKTWVYRYRSPVNDKLRQIKIGTWPAMPPAEAAGLWSDLRARREAGEDPAQEKKQARYKVVSAPEAGYTMKRMVEHYHDEHLALNRKPKGALLIKKRLLAAIVGYEGMEVERTGRRFVHDFLMAKSEAPVLAQSVRSEMGAAWAHAANAGRISEDLPNWWRQVEMPTLRSKGAMRDGKRKGTGKRVLRPEELRLLFTDQLRLFSQQVQDFLVLQQWTCARGGEICQMHTDQLRRGDDGVLWWTVPKELTKVARFDSASDYRVPLVGRAEAVVVRLMGERLGWLFPSVSRSGERTYVKQPYMQSKVHYRQPYSNCRKDHVRERLRVTHWSPHDLRRTGRTMLAALGCPSEIAEAIIGHVKPGIEGVYNLYAYDREKVEWLTKLANQLEVIVSASEPLCSGAEGSPTPAG